MHISIYAKFAREALVFKRLSARHYEHTFADPHQQPALAPGATSSGDEVTAAHDRPPVHHAEILALTGDSCPPHSPTGRHTPDRLNPIATGALNRSAWPMASTP